ncbi:site-specific DNA-methyltransferase [Streptococcus suis]
MPKDFNELPHQNEKNEALDYVRVLIDQARIDGRNEDVVQLDKIIKLLNRKKYGLVWEEHAELVEEEMKTRIPVFIEDETRKIRANPEDKDYNFLLEGDNLHSLHLLEKTHAGRIDVIYIDPPYNTGNKDFKYNDRFVDKTDGYAHSKWLSFMSKRLEIARKLLSDSGVIFISIDDNEQAQLKLLCDEVFGSKNFIAQITRQVIKGGSQSTNIRRVHDYVLIYVKSIDLMTVFTGYEKEKIILDLEDEQGRYAKGRELNKWGAGSRREDSPTMWFPIVAPDGTDVYPIRSDGSEGRWRWGKKKLLEAVKNNNVIFEFKEDGRYVVYEKVRGQKTDRTQFTTWFQDKYVNSKGSQSLKKLFGGLMSVFDFAKPVELIYDLVFMANNRNAIVLDFFAGSGTTGHAVAQLNKEDGGNRKYILCTNNENNICEEVTYKRLTNIQDDLPHNLKYFKTKFLSKDDEELEFSLLHHVHTLIELEHGIDLKESDKAAAFSLSDLRKLDLSGIKTVYVRQQSHAMMEKSDLVRFEGIELIDVPEYYFAKEMREAGI